MGARLVPVNFFDEVEDLAVTPAAVSTMPITNLQSDVRDDVWRSPNLDVQTITGSFGGGARRISHFSIWPATEGSCLLGAKVRVRLFPDVARASAAVYDSGTLDVFTFTGLGWGVFPWGPHPWGVEHGDRTARLTALLRYFTAVSASSFEITISNGGAVDTPYFEARRFWLGDYVEAPYNALLGVAPKWGGNSVQRRTVGGSLRRNRRAVWRELPCEIPLDSEAHRAAWSDLCHVADPATEIIFSLFQIGDGARLERDHTVMGSLEVVNPVVWENVDFHKLRLAILES